MTTTTTLAVPEIGPDDDALTAALAYAGAGWFVLPVRHQTKNPGSIVGADWEQQASRDSQQIAAWFAGTSHGIALAVGKSGACAFDGDHPELLAGTALLQAVVERQPPQQRTRPSEGRCHWLFRQPEGRQVGNGGAGPWGDVRGVGGVIIVAPSVHPDPGGRYEWLRTGEVPSMPGYLAATLPDVSAAELPASFEECVGFAADHPSGQRMDLLNRILAEVDRGLASQARHPLFVSWTTTAMREAAAGCYPAQAALDALQRRFVAAEGQGPGRRRSAAEQGKEWLGIMSWAVGQAALADPADTLAKVAELEAEPLTFRGFDTPPRVEQPTPLSPNDRQVAPKLGDSPESEPDSTEVAVQRELVKIRIRTEARRRFEEEQADAATALDVARRESILARPTEPPGRVEGLVPWGGGTLVVAQRKTGKTTFTLNLVRSLATGEPFLGLPVQRVTGQVVFLNLEVSARQIATWAADAGIPDDRLVLVNTRGLGNPFGSDLVLDRLAETLAPHGSIESLVVDPFGAAFTGDNENDAGQVRRWLDRLEVFARARLGVADLILTAHAGKGGNGASRGSSALEDWPDSIIRLTQDDDGMRVVSAIGRDIDMAPHELKYDSLTRALTLGDPVDAAVERRAATAAIGTAVEAVEAWPGCSGSELLERLRGSGRGVRKATLLDALKQAAAQGLVRVEGVGPRISYHPRLTRS